MWYTTKEIQSWITGVGLTSGMYAWELKWAFKWKKVSMLVEKRELKEDDGGSEKLCGVRKFSLPGISVALCVYYSWLFRLFLP